MEWTKILILSVLISFCSCKNYYVSEGGGYRPKKSNFKFAKLSYQLKKDDLIDINSVYINVSEMNYGGKNHIDNHFMRFFTDGRYFEDLESSDKTLNLTPFNSVNNSLMIGYYKIEKTNFLTLEYFRVKHEEGGFYDTREGYVRNDSIFLYYDSYKNNEFPIPNKENCRIYVRKETKGLTGNPDW